MANQTTKFVSPIGTTPLRVEGAAKVRGQAVYVDDLPIAGAIYGATVRSRVAKGLLRGIVYHPNVPWDEITVVTATDIPGKNTIRLIEDDQPALADLQVNHVGEPVVLLAHPSREMVERARQSIELLIEPLPAVPGLDEPPLLTEPPTDPEILMSDFIIEKGLPFKELGSSPSVYQADYRTPAVDQLYIEPQGMVALASPKHGITVWGSLQCPYYIVQALATLFGLPKERVRVIQCETGGGFGGKEEYPSVIAAHAALLAWKARRPVKLIYERDEDLAATTKRHPSFVRIRSALNSDGRLLGLDIDFTLDAGAYITLSPVVLSRGALHACGPYFCDNVRIRARALRTNTPPRGAFRGFGAPQSIFAIESHLNYVADSMGISRIELRRRNFLKPGQTMATGQVLRDHIDLDTLLDRALALSDYTTRTRENENHKVDVLLGKNRMARGIGLSCFLHGAGFTGSGELMLGSKVVVDATETGLVRVRASSTEMGQGKNTVLTQIAQDALGVPTARIEIVQPDTSEVPDSGPTVASRTVMVVGKLVHKACLALKQKLMDGGLLAPGYTAAEFAAACAAFHAKAGPLSAESLYEHPQELTWDDKAHQGDAYATYAWGVYVAEVEVDTLTGEVTVQRFFAIQDAGKIVHPLLAAGQIEGGVAQGLGFALLENPVVQQGTMLNNRLSTYIIPTSRDVPDIYVEFVDQAGQAGKQSPYGPNGAKGIGELPLDGTAPAVAGAVSAALGIVINRLPVTPDLLLQTWEKNRCV